MNQSAHRTARLTLLTYAVLASGALTGSAIAAAPKAVIDGRTQVDLGNPVLLDASRSVGDAFVWLLDRDIDFLESEDSRKVYFMTGAPGRYTFTLVAITAPEKAGEKPLVDKSRFTVTFGNPNPGPNPGPNPVPPGPNPEPLPPGKYGLAVFARDSAAAVQLDPATKRSTATALANSYESIASTIAAGALTKGEDIIAATKANNITAIGVHRQAWMPWATAMQSKCNALSEGKTLVTPEDHITAWREIATGLRAVQ